MAILSRLGTHGDGFMNLIAPVELYGVLGTIGVLFGDLGNGRGLFYFLVVIEDVC